MNFQRTLETGNLKFQEIYRTLCFCCNAMNLIQISDNCLKLSNISNNMAQVYIFKYFLTPQKPYSLYIFKMAITGSC